MQCNLKFLKQTENANKKLRKGKRGGGGTPYTSLTPALIKDQNKALRNIPRVNEEISEKAKNDRETNNVSKGFIKQGKNEGGEIGTATKLREKTLPFKMSITATG